MPNLAYWGYWARACERSGVYFSLHGHLSPQGQTLPCWHLAVLEGILTAVTRGHKGGPNLRPITQIPPYQTSPSDSTYLNLAPAGPGHALRPCPSSLPLLPAPSSLPCPALLTAPPPFSQAKREHEQEVLKSRKQRQEEMAKAKVVDPNR